MLPLLNNKEGTADDYLSSSVSASRLHVSLYVYDPYCKHDPGALSPCRYQMMCSVPTVLRCLSDGLKSHEVPLYLAECVLQFPDHFRIFHSPKGAWCVRTDPWSFCILFFPYIQQTLLA